MNERLPFGLREAGLTHYRTEEEREFLEALQVRAEAAGWYADAWPRANSITLSVTVNDVSTGELAATLRIDFDGRKISVGYDPTHQLLDEWEPWPPDDDNERRSSRELAADAANWIEMQLAIEHAKQDDHVLELPVPMPRRRPF